MKTFGRFEFGKDEPSEIYEGTYMRLEKGYVKIFRGEPSLLDPLTEQIIAVIHVDKGQSMREIEPETR